MNRVGLAKWCASGTAKVPQNASPAPTVSIALTLNAGWMQPSARKRHSLNVTVARTASARSRANACGSDRTHWQASWPRFRSGPSRPTTRIGSEPG